MGCKVGLEEQRQLPIVRLDERYQRLQRGNGAVRLPEPRPGVGEEVACHRQQCRLGGESDRRIQMIGRRLRGTRPHLGRPELDKHVRTQLLVAAVR